MPMALRTTAGARGDLLAGGDDRVVFGEVVEGAASLHQATSSLVLPDMAETTTATW